MKITNTIMPFKGYDAAPLKNVYMGTMDSEEHLDIFKELKRILSSENIGLYSLDGKGILDNPSGEFDRAGCFNIWNQDHIAFIKGKNGVEVFSFDGFLPPDTKKEFSTREITPVEKMIFTDGGNLFLGKKENGEDYILAGSDSEFQATNLAESLNIKKENIHIIPQGAFHIDMEIRPIGFPYVLVNDVDLACENIQKLDKTQEEKDNYIAQIRKADFSLKKHNVFAKTAKEIAKSLEEQGFKPILIGGNYFSNMNFMNALVHKRNDGTLCYITNSAQNLGKVEEKLQEIFETELKQKVPNLHSVHFVLGEKARQNNRNNIESFLFSSGGVHCLCAEEPNFDIWV